MSKAETSHAVAMPDHADALYLLNESATQDGSAIDPEKSDH